VGASCLLDTIRSGDLYFSRGAAADSRLTRFTCTWCACCDVSLAAPTSRQHIQSGVSAFNCTSRTWRYPRGTGALFKPPSPGARSRDNLWLTTTLVIGLVASPCRAGSVACDIAKEAQRPAATLGDSRARVVPARFSRVITAAGCLSSTPSRRALTTPAPPSIVQPPPHRPICRG
jgi:hypothetical protein